MDQLGSKINEIVPPYPFIDRTGRARRIDFAYTAVAIEVRRHSISEDTYPIIHVMKVRKVSLTLIRTIMSLKTSYPNSTRSSDKSLFILIYS